MHKYQTIVRIHQTDAGGIVYFANFFVLAHECYESFLDTCKSIGSIIDGGEIVIPIVHAESDYKMPLKVSEKVTVEMTLDKMSKTSFGLTYTIFNQSRQVAAEVNTVHAVLENSTWKAVKIPQFLKTALNSL